MKTQIYSLLLCALWLLTGNGCTEDAITNHQADAPDKEYQAALNQVLTFDNGTATKSNSALIIKSSSVQTYSYKLKGNTQTRATAGTEIPDSASINIYTFVFEKDGNQGFAIASGDERISRVYAYTENGQLSDTTYIVGLAYTLSMFPSLYEEELNNYYSGESKETKAATTYINIGPTLITQWHQEPPYNNQCPPRSGCAHSVVGCGGIAAAQVLAYLNPAVKMSGIDYSVLRAYATPPYEYQNMAALFCFNVAQGIETNFGCKNSTSQLKTTAGYLSKFGITLRFYDGNLKINDCINSIALKGVTMARGTQKNGAKIGHAWVYDGVRATVYLTGDSNWPYTKTGTWPTFHCNWGWGPQANGWYAASTGWEQPNPNTDPYIADNAQIYFLSSLH
ncbi:MAG: C10 family peptidase [Parabacteroides sp.]|nr:C10 family peptidase [Parabacteroides sp.]